MKLRFLRVNSFTDQPFSGNPATVCFLQQPGSDDWMQSVAAEVNTGGTAFLSGSGDELRLRFFTPAVEVELSGHTTLAAAHALWEEGLLQRNAPARFRTKAGPLGAERRGKWTELDFPSEPQQPIECPAVRQSGDTPLCSFEDTGPESSDSVFDPKRLIHSVLSLPAVSGMVAAELCYRR